MSCSTCTSSDTQTTAAFVALTCKHAKISGYRTCAINKLPVAARSCDDKVRGVACLKCPIGKGVDASGNVRWLWIKWRGLPAPKRWVLCDGPFSRWVYGHRPALSWDIPACGCIDKLKTWWERVRAA